MTLTYKDFKGMAIDLVKRVLEDLGYDYTESWSGDYEEYTTLETMGFAICFYDGKYLMGYTI